MFAVPAAPVGTHPVTNYRIALNSGSNRAEVLVQIVGQWSAVSFQDVAELQLLIGVLQCPYIGVVNGFLVGSRSPAP